MTIEEKRKALKEHCVGKNCVKDGCPLFDINTPYGCCGEDVPADVLNEHYELVFGKTETTKDNVNHPNHYNQDGAMECIDEMVLVFGKEATMNFCLLNVWKYRYRANAKNGKEDMDKANEYMKLYKKLKESVG